MSDYTFTTLAPNEFEDLSKDLLEHHLAVPLQAFTTGRDGGIDLRHAPAKGQPWVVQCKHYAGSRFADLKRSVSKEVKKLHVLKPQRYVLATSCGLTPGNVDELYDLLSPFCTSKHDILGKSDLNAILRDKGEVERRHPKLWITSEAVLNRVLQNDVFVQSDMTRESILRRLSLYVYTSRFEDARKKLNADRVCIISGVPGVGKTTLAEMLLVEHLMDGWELVTIHQNVSEGLRALQVHPDSKQVFYYDDFLGQVSSGDKLAKNEDGALLQLLRAIQHSASKRFILTTREYILAQAKREHEKLSRANLDIYRFVVECKDFDEEAKARILANHLYFNDVPQEHIAAIVRDEGYREIIDHDNYNPRLIESMTSRMEFGILKSEEYLAAFVARLDDPSQLWEHIYEEQLSEASRHVLLALASTGTPATLLNLEQDFQALFGKRCKEFGWIQRPNDFERSLNELEGNFLRVQDRGSQRVVEWHNPSVLDFLGSWLRRHRRDTEALLESATRFEQVSVLTNSVPVLVPNEGQLVESPPVEAVVADSINRTSSDMTWAQLQTALRLGDRFSEGLVRNQIIAVAEQVIGSADLGVEEIPVVIAVIEQMQKCDWIDRTQLANWQDRVKSQLLSFDEDSFDQLEHFMPLAKWANKNRPLLAAEEFKAIQERSARVVKSEATASFSPNMESIWTEMKERAEELQELLSVDLRREIETIEGEIENADKPESSSYRVEQKIQPPAVLTIDSIFESLIE
jgi:hypothetical protein